MDQRRIGFNRIYVIESLEEGTRTGSNLYNDLLRYREYSLEHIYAELVVIETKDDFVKFHAKILNDLVTTSQVPYLHFEMHGCIEGLMLASDELVTWDELYEFCLPINRATGNNLFVSFASCYGAYIFNVVDPSEYSPFFGYIGAPAEIYPSEIEASFNAYFETLLRTFDFNIAVDALNLANPKGPHRFVVYSTEQIFDIYSKKFIDALNDPAFRQARFENIRRLASERSGLKDLSEDQIKWAFEKQIDYISEISKRKEKFLLRDVSPH
jgi:hypothetical protein